MMIDLAGLGRENGGGPEGEDTKLSLDFWSCGVAQRQNVATPKNKKQQDSFFVIEDFFAHFDTLLR